MGEPIVKPKIGLLLGDPSGIGPEIAAKLLSFPETSSLAELLVLGDQRLLPPTLHGVPILDWRLSHPSEYPLATASAVSGAYVLGVLKFAAEVIQRKEIDALVYAPLNKAAMKLAGMHEEDEMHFLANQWATPVTCRKSTSAMDSAPPASPRMFRSTR